MTIYQGKICSQFRKHKYSAYSVRLNKTTKTFNIGGEMRKLNFVICCVVALLVLAPQAVYADPIIISEPSPVTLAVGDSAEFTVVVGDANDYQWYKEGTGALGGEISPTLSIGSVVPGDEGYYYCVMSDVVGSSETLHVRLLTERLMSHWTFDNSLADTVVGGNVGTFVDPVVANPPFPTASYDTGIVGGGQAIIIPGDEKHVEVGNQEYYNFFLQGCTVVLTI